MRMGLDFNNSNVRWGYGSFHEFRKKLGLEVGIVLEFMEGFYRIPSEKLQFDYVCYVHDKYKKAYPEDSIAFIPSTPIKRDKIQDDIVPFLNHSDCDGHLSPTLCGKIGRRLRELVKGWDDKDIDKQKALELADDMLECHKNKKRLSFC